MKNERNGYKVKKLSYEVLKEQGYEGYLLEQAPERVLQFGEGNFMRALPSFWTSMGEPPAC